MRNLILALLALAVALPATAQAAEPSAVNFDDLPAGTEVTDQYFTPGRLIQFGNPNRFDVPPAHDPCPTSQNTGGLLVHDGGIAGRSLSLRCSGNELESSFYAAFHTTQERRGVSFRLRGHDLYDDKVTIKLYGVGAQELETRAVTVAGDEVKTVAVTRSGPDLVMVTLQAYGPGKARLSFDDLSMPLDDIPEPPKFAIGLGKPAIDIVEGGSVTVPVNLLRYNGSSGAITMSLGTLPAGIAAAQVTPNPVTGTNGPMLTITADAPLSGQRQISLTAAGAPSAGTFVGGGKVQSVNGVPAIVAAGGPGSEQTVVPGCGPSQASLGITVRGGYSGFIDAYFQVLDGPVEFDRFSTGVTASGNGTLALRYDLRQAAGSTGPSTIRIALAPAGATPIVRDVRVFAQPVRIDKTATQIDKAGGTPGFQYASQLSPIELNPGRSTIARSNTLDVMGSFPEGCDEELTFVDVFNRTVPIAGRRDGPGGATILSLRLPTPPVSTIVRALGAAKLELARSGRIDVVGYRNAPALSAANSGVNAGTPRFTWSDFLRAFGKDDGEACASVFGCYRDPFALASYAVLRATIEANGGLCFGFATLSMLFADGNDMASRYESGRRPWELVFAERNEIKSETIRWQLAQYDGDWQDYRGDLKDDVPSFAQFRDRLRSALVSKDEVVIAISSGGSGHAVVAYDMADRGDGGIDILTYNPNTPYAAAEETNRATLDANLAASRITVSSAGRWAGGISGWTGGMDTIEIYERMPPNEADLPFGHWLQALGAAPGTAEVSAIRVGGAQALRPDGTALPGTGVKDQIGLTGVHSDIGYELTRGRSYDFTVTGKSSGTYANGLLGASAGATVEGLRTAIGQQDHVTLTPGKAALGVRSGNGSPAKITLLDRVGSNATHTASIALDTRKGGSDDVVLSGSALTLTHRGAATSVAATLGSFGTGAPAAVTTRAIRVGTGERLTLTPVSWADPGAGVKLTLRDRRGRVLRRGRARLRTTRAVAIGAVKARIKRSGGKVTVTVSGRVTKAGSAPLLAARVQVRRGHTLLQSTGRSLRGEKVPRGKFTVPVTLKRLPRGAKMRVIVTLTDEAADFATARRHVSTR